MRKLIVILVFVFILGLNAQFAKVGINGLKFLDIGVDARAIGMGEAYAALAEGASSVFWNPAGINRVQGINVFTHYNRWWADIMHGSFSFTYNLGLNGTVGFFFNGLHSGQIEETTVDQPEGTGRTFTYYAYEAGLTYGRFLTDRFALGLNLKMVSEHYPNTPKGEACNTYGVGFDVGGIYTTNFRDLSIGLVMMNFGPDVTPTGTYYNWEDGVISDSAKTFKPFPLPNAFRGGLSMTLYEQEPVKILGAFDVFHPGDNVERYNLGVEVGLMNMVFLRGGYEFGRDDNVLALNGGLGFLVNTGNAKIAIDFAYSDGSYLPATQRLSVKVGF